MKTGFFFHGKASDVFAMISVLAHLYPKMTVKEYRVASIALCGRSPIKRGSWRMTSNVPFGNACRHCTKSKYLVAQP